MEILALLLPYLGAGLRLVHLLSFAFWIGTTLYLTRMARNLVATDDPDQYGTVWGAHGGTIWVYAKRKTMPKGDQELHWFKWESLATWASGISLLILNWWGEQIFSLDSIKAFGLMFITAAWYWIVWRWIKPNSRWEMLGIILSLVSLMSLTWVFSLFLDPFRLCYHLGGTLATIMAIVNVWGTILPAQRDIVRVLQQGGQVNEVLAARAMRCTKHNTYIMPTVVMLMMCMHLMDVLHMGNHAWLSIGIIALVGGCIGHLLRKKF